MRRGGCRWRGTNWPSREDCRGGAWQLWSRRPKGSRNWHRIGRVRQTAMQLRVDGFGVTWTVESRDSVTVEETGPHPASPPMLVVSGTTSVVSLALPTDVTEWPACAAFLLRLRDGVDDLAALLAARVATPVGPDGGRD